MEEILASIRKIISEDGENGTQTQAAQGIAAAVQGDSMAEDELELIDEVPPSDEDELEIEFMDDDDDDGDLELELAPRPQPQARPEPAFAPAPPAAQPVDFPAIAATAATEDVVSNLTASMGTASFAALERSIRMGQAGETLEDVIKNLLKPMLRNWLDQNLPSMVERLVQFEIQKMSSGARQWYQQEEHH